MDRLTPPVINRVPPGLLNFFGLKNGGRNPSALGETLAPVLDLREFYEQDALEVYGDTTVVAAGGAIGSFDFGGAGILPGIVPEDEFWHVHTYSVQLNTAAGLTRYVFCPTIQIRRTAGPGAGGRIAIAVGDPIAYQGAALAAEVHLMPAAGPFWLPPGGILAGLTSALTPLATAVSAFANVRFVRYRRI